ncbi:hypothetical protein [Halobacterium salinarum]|nr:hypothetical protein [Halobacterium salinarum]
MMVLNALSMLVIATKWALDGEKLFAAVLVVGLIIAHIIRKFRTQGSDK